jgi:hypothetical protein
MSHKRKFDEVNITESSSSLLEKDSASTNNNAIKTGESTLASSQPNQVDESRAKEDEITFKPMNFYKSTPVGRALLETLNEMIQSGELTMEVAQKIEVISCYRLI